MITNSFGLIKIHIFLSYYFDATKKTIKKTRLIFKICRIISIVLFIKRKSLSYLSFDILNQIEHSGRIDKNKNTVTQTT